MKPKYKPSADSKVELEWAKRWYARLDHTDKKSVNKKIARMVGHVTKGKSQFSHTAGIELIYKVLRRM